MSTMCANAEYPWAERVIEPSFRISLPGQPPGRRFRMPDNAILSISASEQQKPG